MKRVIKCAIILHNPFGQELGYEVCEDGQQATDGIIVEKGRPSIWKKLVKLQGDTSTGGQDCSAARCDLEKFKKDKAEHDLTNRLLMDHLCNHHGLK